MEKQALFDIPIKKRSDDVVEWTIVIDGEPFQWAGYEVYVEARAKRNGDGEPLASYSTIAGTVALDDETGGIAVTMSKASKADLPIGTVPFDVRRVDPAGKDDFPIGGNWLVSDTATSD